MTAKENKVIYIDNNAELMKAMIGKRNCAVYFTSKNQIELNEYIQDYSKNANLTLEYVDYKRRLGGS